MFQRIKTEHPTGLVAVGLSTLVTLGLLVAAEWTAAIAVGSVGVLTAATSAATPRYDTALQVADNDPWAGGTGPDEQE